ncbi:chemotaxis-specific protein-glutamate methyltransferase CheB [Sphingomonas sp. PB2P19]|uniref:chemotaxis-specific protein-glutamate methyltransferase CheB n=1 Tax=Sphingomonas rhamnosi TaxID=3096156 RepID=UPI002FC9BF39
MIRPVPSRFAAFPHDDKARVLIVDDSVVARAVMGRMIDASERFWVAGAVGTAKAALDFLGRVVVDFILLDIAMPGIDGLTALPDLIAAGGSAKVLIVSSSADEGAATTIQALALGAAETLAKPESSAALSAQFGRALLDKLERLRDPHLPSPRTAAQVVALPVSSAPTIPNATSDDYDIVAIGASTGGIHALSQLLRALPVGFRLPIVVTQHLPTSFMPYFAAQLAVLGGRPCDVATDSLRIRAGRIVVAPGDAHLKCVKLADGGAALRLVTDPAASGCMPSVDPMLASMADVYGARMLAVVLSGMGRDGADGARRVHDAGGCVIAQDQASSVVWGMPGAVAAAGIADAVMTPYAIGRLVASRRRP